jgi:hypothetical protein
MEGVAKAMWPPRAGYMRERNAESYLSIARAARSAIV